MSKKVKILIVASVVLNVLLAGVIIGNMVHHQFGRWSSFRNDRVLAAKLSPEKYKLFTEVMGVARSDCKQIRKQIRATRAETLEILMAPEFDEQSFEREVGRLRDLRVAVSDRVADATLQLAKQFDAEERQVLGKFLERPRRP